MNKHGGFFSDWSTMLRHVRLQSWQVAQERWRAAADATISGWHRGKDLARAYWLLISYHVWRSGPCRRVGHVLNGALLLALATMLKWCGYPHRRWFERMHGTRTLTLRPAPAFGTEVAQFAHATPNWLGAKVEAAAHASDARWMVWQCNDAPVPLNELRPLFDDERTFAVSIQNQYRGWKPSLLPMAPFRALQKGEASQVLAPLSSVIVVDRQKLLALRIPDCDLAITAWLLLFWKAAAAGWRSYSIGQEHELNQQPDYPVHETEFFLHALANPEFTELCAVDPDLARGSVAFCPAVRKAARSGSDRLQVLIVSPFLPYPLSHGGAVRIYNLCLALRDRVDFILAAVRETDDTVHYDKLHAIFRDIAVVDMDEFPVTAESLPQQVCQYQSRSLRALIGDLSRTYRPDLIQIEYAHMALFRDAAPDLPALLVEHDLTFSLYSQLAECDPTEARHREFQRWAAFERQQLQEFDGVWTVSEEDRIRVVREGRNCDRTYTVPNGVDTSFFTPVNDFAAVPELLYVGSFRHLPNILGFEMLCREIMPRVWSKFPEVRLHVVAGPNYESFWRTLRPGASPLVVDDRMTIHGFVEDMRPLYSAARAVVVPLAVSAGTNIKVLEAMACGKAIVTTPMGCSGLELRNGHEVLIGSGADEFVGALYAILSDTALRSRLSTQARATAEERFSWRAIARVAYDSYAMLASRPVDSGLVMSGVIAGRSRSERRGRR